MVDDVPRNEVETLIIDNKLEAIIKYNGVLKDIQMEFISADYM